jgi:hypothetical protein
LPTFLMPFNPSSPHEVSNTIDNKNRNTLFMDMLLLLFVFLFES